MSGHGGKWIYLVVEERWRSDGSHRRVTTTVLSNRDAALRAVEAEALARRPATDLTWVPELLGARNAEAPEDFNLDDDYIPLPEGADQLQCEEMTEYEIQVRPRPVTGGQWWALLVDVVNEGGRRRDEEQSIALDVIRAMWLTNPSADVHAFLGTYMARRPEASPPA